MSDLSFNEKELFEFWNHEFGKNIKYMFYNEPCLTMEDIIDDESISLDTKATDINGYCIALFKNKSFAVRALVSLALNSIPFKASFGGQQEPDENGLISNNSLMEGFLQVLIPLQQKEEKKENENEMSIIDTFYGSEAKLAERDEELPQYWVRVTDDSIAGYRKLDRLFTTPTFEINLLSCRCSKSSKYRFDVVDTFSNQTFTFGSTNPKAIVLWTRV